eukprot:209150_1
MGLETRYVDPFYYITSVIFGITGCIIIMVIITHISVHLLCKKQLIKRRKKKHSKNKMSEISSTPSPDTPNRTPNNNKRETNEEDDDTNVEHKIYYLMYTFLCLCLIHLFMYGFIRTNILIDWNYTKHICSFGYFLSYFSISAAKCVMYNIFTYRIQISFDGTVYQYKLYILMTLYVIPWISFFISLVVLFASVNQWVIHNGKSIQFCNIYTPLPMIIILLFTFCAIVEISMNVILLGLFARGLHAMYIQSEEIYAKQYGDNIENHHGLQMEIRINKFSRQITTQTITIQQKQAIEFIDKLRKLVKKHTVLVFLCLCSTVPYWICVMINGLFAVESIVDTCVNAICLWLMFICSNNIWLWSKKYFICKLCYLKCWRNLIMWIMKK